MPLNTRAYENDQGKGLATVLDLSNFWRMKQYQFQEDKAKQAAADKKKAAALKTLNEKRPDVKWAEYMNQLNDGYYNLYNQAAKLITDENIDVWTSSDPRARQLREGFHNLNNGTDRVNALYEEYITGLKAVQTRGDEYTDESVQDLMNMPDQVDINDMIRGYTEQTDPKTGKVKRTPVRVPELMFKNPSTLFNSFYVNGTNHLKQFKSETGFVDPSKVNEWAVQYFSSPENETNLKAANQAYQALDPDSAYAKQVQSYAYMNGLKGRPGVAMAIMGLNNMLQPEGVNLTEEMVALAKDAPLNTKKTRIEDISGVTTGTLKQYLQDPQYADKQAAAFLTANSWIINRPDVLATIGIDPGKHGGPNAVYQATHKALKEMIENNIVRRSEFTKSIESDSAYGGHSKKEFDTNQDDWLRRIESRNQTIANEAIGFLEGIQMPGTSGRIESAEIEVYKGGTPGIDPNLRGEIRLNFQDQNKARQFRQKALDLFLKTPPSSIQGDFEAIEDWKRDQTQVFEELNKHELGVMVKIPINVDNYQFIKELHRNAVQKKKELYLSRDGKRYNDRLDILDQPDPLGIGGTK